MKQPTRRSVRTQAVNPAESARPLSAQSKASGSKRKPSVAGLHPRNRHQGRYDFPALLACSPELANHLITTAYGERSIDFSLPASVRALNAALLRLQYGVEHWQIPDGYLCPPVPGRADYIHGLADLLADDNGGQIPRGRSICALDIGVGANLIYPLIGHAEYGWRFIGSDIDAKALAIAQRILDRNPQWHTSIELRQQERSGQIFTGIVSGNGQIDVSLCNPPFHASASKAARGSQQKWHKLGKPDNTRRSPILNFGGQSNELCCQRGEAAFLRRMIEESAALGSRVLWFSSLVAKSEHLAPLRKRLDSLEPQQVRVIKMAQGAKQSRFLAWTFQTQAQRREWAAGRWQTDAGLPS